MINRECFCRHACQDVMQMHQSAAVLALMLSHYLTVLNLSPLHQLRPQNLHVWRYHSRAAAM